MIKKPLVVAVPTTTIIIAKEGEENMVVVFDSNGKHGSKRVLPGGKIRVGIQGPIEAGLAEAREEVGISDLENVKLFTVCTKPDRDVRQPRLRQYLDGRDVPTGVDEDEVEVEAYFAFDFVIMATSKLDPKPDGEETENVYFMDVHEINPEEFALDHGELLVAYARYLQTGKKPDFGDF